VITKNAGLIFTKPLAGGSDRGQRAFTIIPHSVPAEEGPPAHAGSDLVTDMWIERCIAVNIVVDPEALVMCKPMPGPFPRPCINPLLHVANCRPEKYCNLNNGFLRSRFTARRETNNTCRSRLLFQSHTEEKSSTCAQCHDNRTENNQGKRMGNTSSQRWMVMGDDSQG
jgi:hypothetical protein